MTIVLRTDKDPVGPNNYLGDGTLLAFMPGSPQHRREEAFRSVAYGPMNNLVTREPTDFCGQYSSMLFTDVAEVEEHIDKSDLVIIYGDVPDPKVDPLAAGVVVVVTVPTVRS